MQKKLLDEAEVQIRIRDNLVVQNGIITALDVEGAVSFEREDPYINGITSDFTMIEDGKIRAIIEGKAGNINVTDYVRGIGQLLQYEYFGQEKIPHKSMNYSDKFSTLYFFPSSVLSNNTFNVARFKYPETTILLELNETNNAVRRITQKELKELNQAEDDNLVTISPYYFRDNRLFEYYILLNYLFFKNQMGYEKCHRKEIEDNFLKKINTINNGNWRNAFITLSNLGLINNNNMLTEAGKQLVIQPYEKFAVTMYHSYMEPYFMELYSCFGEEKSISASNQDLSSIIRKKYKGRDVLYLTQSNGRYISSWMNILRDDFGIVGFEARCNDRTLNYNPSELNDSAFEDRIKNESVAYEYIDRYKDLIKRGN